jgi:hypothetical protein
MIDFITTSQISQRYLLRKIPGISNQLTRPVQWLRYADS